MNIIIVGGGVVGINLAEILLQTRHHITIIEQDKSRGEYISDRFDVSVVNGIGSDPSILKKAEIDKADILIAVTPSDETNLLVCNFAMQEGVEKRIARIRSDIYTTLDEINLEKLGVTHIIEPEREMVKSIMQYVELPGVTETANFQSDNIYIRGYRITGDMPVANKTLFEIRQIAKNSPLLIVVIVREGKSLPPIGSQTILPGDRIVAIMPRDSFAAFRSLLNRKASKLGKIVVSGNTIAAIQLTRSLKPFCGTIVLADSDLEHSKLAASELNGIDVFHGDCTDSEFLQELYIQNTDFFIAAGSDSEDNIMACLLAKEEGAKNTIAIRYDTRYAKLFRKMGINHVINPHDITLNMIIEKIRKIPIGTYLSLKTADVEIVRCKTDDQSTLIGKPLREHGNVFEKNIIIGCIIRSDEVIIPGGDTVINEGDEIMVFCNSKYVDLAHSLFDPGKKLDV
ncbi:MAG: Trk system potassium transporter TrkA [Candidatus Omnitrophota bacterium]